MTEATPFLQKCKMLIDLTQQTGKVVFAGMPP